MSKIINAVKATKAVKEPKTVKVLTKIDITEYFQAMIFDTNASLAFFGHILARCRRVASKDLKTLAIGLDRSGFVLYYNEEFVNTLSYDQFLYVIKHELLHGVLGHHERGTKSKVRMDHEMDNIAMDLAINSMLGDPPGDMPLLMPGEGEFQDYPRGESYEQYLRRLKKDIKKKIDQLEKSGLLQKIRDGEVQVNWEGHDERDKNSAEDESGNAMVRKIIKDALDTCKARGTMPGELERLIEGRFKPKVNWKTQLRRFHGQFHIMGTKFTNKRPNRRQPNKIGIVPGQKNKYTCKLLVVVDTSGSIDQRQFKAFLSECAHIPIPYTLIQADAAICDVKKVRKGSQLHKLGAPKGGGGTDFNPAFDMAKKGGYDGVIYLTDMYGSFPASFNKPTLWVSTTNVDKAPFGKVINIKIDAEEEGK